MIHLNRTRVSQELGDRNVCGVFERDISQDEDVISWEFTVAHSGDFYIRIHKDTKISMGDLLISRGDGTAYPQSDDIVRSSTIAKVNSTKRLKTFEDGSYIIPCNLMCS